VTPERTARRLRCLMILTAACALSCQEASTRPGSAAGEPKSIKTPSGIEMVLIPAGWFEMGSRNGDPDEAPVHRVWVDAFLMDRYEVTQEQWAKVAESSPFLSADPAHFKGPSRPVEMISWDLAALYCNARSRAEGLEPCYDEEGACRFEANGYRLPTEAEWEYACRGASATRYSFGDDPRLLNRYAWYAGNSLKTTHPVGMKKPNPLGLFDMHGNVAEWCNDVYSADYYKTSPARNPRGAARGEHYVLRGGAWSSSANVCRSAYRVGEAPGAQDACFAQDAVGFRCVRRPPPELLGAQGAAGPKGRAAARTGLVYGDIYLQHKTGAGHPERPQRLVAIVDRLKKKELLPHLLTIEPRAAAEQWLTTVHTPDYVKRVKQSCQAGVGHVDTPDAPAGRGSYEVAIAAVGGTLAAIDAVVEGKIANAFCAVRPPGHHARPSRAMGFCLFNNVAIAARYIQRKHKLAKVLIVDWDVHHGNGTQEMFYDDPTVFYFGIHQSPFYPGTGGEDERGKGKGQGATLNVPLPAGSGDREYRQAFEQKLRPAALAFKPDFVLISAGFDAHEDDLLGRMKVTTEGFAELTRIVKAIAERHCRGRLVSVLEGGYHLDGLAASVEAHIRVLME